MEEVRPKSKMPPPIGAAPDGEDFSHPWIISAIVSTICFGVGFVFMYSTGLWANFSRWADGPFLFYFAILTPVIIGFIIYGTCTVIGRLFFRRPAGEHR